MRRVVPLPSLSPWGPPKSETACCLAKVDKEGRLPIGYCGPDCTRRPQKATP